MRHEFGKAHLGDSMSWEKHFALGKAKVLLWEKQIKYFGKGGKGMSFFVRDDNMLDKYNEI